MKGYIYIGVSVIVAIIGIFLIYQLGSKQETLQNDIEIQNITVRPSTIKVGDTFTINATLVNNSQNPIYVDVSPCSNPVIIDSHVRLDDKHELCEDILAMHKVNSGENFTMPFQNSGDDFKATTAGATSVIVKLFYSENPQTIHSNTVSKSFSFMILDK